MYTDPSGEILISTAILIGAAVAAATYTMTALLADVPFSVGGLAKATFIGAASAAVTFGIGSGAESMFTNFYSKAAFQAVAHGTFQGGMSEISGGKFWSGFATGALSSIASSAWSGGNTGQWQGIGGKFADSGAGMIAFGTVSGGAGAALTGGNFWQGAVTGLVVSALNHAAHQMQEELDLDSFAKEKFGADYKKKFGVKSLKWGSQMKKGEVEGYRYNRKEMMIYNTDKKAVGATTAGDRIYFSDIYKTYPNIYLEGTMGHEFIHAYHHMKFGNNSNSSHSEFSAYQYSIDFSLKNNLGTDYINVFRKYQKSYKEGPASYNYNKIPGFKL